MIVVAALALTLVPLALAGASGGGGWKHGKAKFNLVGTVTAVDASAGTMTIDVKAGTRSVRVLRDAPAPVTLPVATGARIRLVSADGCVKIELGQVPAPGAKVKARGKISGAGTELVYTVYDVKVKAPAVVPEPSPAE